jgi:hypothetical protein
MMAKLVAVKCKFYLGMFQSEGQFEVILADGEVHRGIAPRYFCWNALLARSPDGARGT